jgi:hypothetical protein
MSLITTLKSEAIELVLTLLAKARNPLISKKN